MAESYSMEDLFGPVIHSYTREQALEDGALVDVSELASEAGFRVPVAVTAALWADVRDIPPSKRGIQDETGRLWDLLYMAAFTVKLGRHAGNPMYFDLLMDVGRKKRYTAKLHTGPGDNGEHVLTLMRPEED